MRLNRNVDRVCRICGNKKKSALSRHHLLPKAIRVKGTPQITIKICRDLKGCQTHSDFHKGDKAAATRIRNCLDLTELVWMVDLVGVEWVETIYPE